MYMYICIGIYIREGIKGSAFMFCESFNIITLK